MGKTEPSAICPGKIKPRSCLYKRKQFSCVGPTLRIPISSACPKDELCKGSLCSGAMKSRKGIGETGDPWGGL